MERRMKHNTKCAGSVNLCENNKSGLKDKKTRKTDAFKEMKRRISSSFGRLNLIKEDGLGDKMSHTEDEATRQKRCYSSTEIHEVPDDQASQSNHPHGDNGTKSQTVTPTKASYGSQLTGSISIFQKASSLLFKRSMIAGGDDEGPPNTGASCLVSSTVSDNVRLHSKSGGATNRLLGDYFRNFWKRSSLKRNQAQHRSLGNVNSVCSYNNTTSHDFTNNSTATNSNQKLPQSCQKQGPAAKITAKIRSRRSTNNHNKRHSNQSVSMDPNQRPHSVARECTLMGIEGNHNSSSNNPIINQAIEYAISNYPCNSNNIKDPMSTSLVLSRPKSDGHCFENIMTTSISTDKGGSASKQKHLGAPQLQHLPPHHHHQPHQLTQNVRSRRVASTSGVEDRGEDSPGILPRQSLYLQQQHSFGRTDSYQKLDMLGEGSYATVFKGHSNLTGQTVALKEIRINPEEGVPFTAIREASLLKNLRHSNIVILHDIVHTKETLTFVFEYVHSDLSKYIERRQPHGIRPLNIKLLLFQLLRGLHFCHQRRILHRDLKPQNLLISEQGELKLADFGLARAKSVPSRTYSNEVVTLWYRPPDVLLGSTEYSASLDMWGVGCIFVEMIGGTAIFPGLKDTDDQLDKIFKIMGSPNERVWPGVTSLPHYASFVQSRLARCSPCSQTPATVYHHKGRPLHRVVHRLFSLPHAESLALAFLQIRPELRVLARSAMAHPYFDDLPRQLLHLPDTVSIYTVPGVRMVPESPISPLTTAPISSSRHSTFVPASSSLSAATNAGLYLPGSTGPITGDNQLYSMQLYQLQNQYNGMHQNPRNLNEGDEPHLHSLIKQDWKAANNFFNTTVQ